MGASASHQTSSIPLIDYRLFNSFTTQKSKSTYTLTGQISSTSPSTTQPKEYKAALSSSARKLEIFNSSSPKHILGLIDFPDVRDGRKKGKGVGKGKFELGVLGEEKELLFTTLEMKGDSKSYAFVSPFEKRAEGMPVFTYEWEITKTTNSGVVKEMLLKVWNEGEGREGEEGEGEIVGLWQKKWTLFGSGGGDGVVWVKMGERLLRAGLCESEGAADGGRQWEILVLGSALGVLEAR